MFYGLPADLRELAELQHGVLTSAQLTSTDLTRDVLSSRVRLGTWQRLYRGVYATFSGEPGRGAALWAAVLWAGPGGLLSYQTAAEVAGLSDKPSSLIHVTVPSNRRVVREPGIAVHYSARAWQAVHPARLPRQTRIEETVLDLAGAAGSLDDAVGWVTTALGRRLTTQARLLEAAQDRAKVRWRRQLTELLSPAAAGIHSLLEYRYHHDVELPHGLPEGKRQARSRRDGHNEYRDTLYEAYSTAVELDGRLAHPADERWSDIRRDNAAAGTGIVTVRFGWLDVTERPCQVAAEVVRVLMARGFAGGRPCSPQCPVGAVTATQRSPAAPA
jgi:predicted transcriptional regulator of viral defense system